tara:strand:- start:854 stop:1360 length:507 start_codon:yes stop_codon:yes gene_type:complete
MFLFSSEYILAQESIYNIEINNIKGEPIDLNKFKGKYILFVNVASECGFTGQYKSLEELYKKYQEDLIIIGTPCNQFGAQEPASEEEIQQFCRNVYGVSFLLTEKIKVKGLLKHPLFLWLTDKRLNGISSSSVKWNFQKYLINPNGVLVDYFYSTTQPMSSKITSRLK